MPEELPPTPENDRPSVPLEVGVQTGIGNGTVAESVPQIVNQDADIPTVTLAEPALEPPGPQFFMSLLWCIAFLIVSQGAVLAILLPLVFVRAQQSGDSKRYLERLLDNLVPPRETARAGADVDNGAARSRKVKIPEDFARDLPIPLFLGQAISLVFVLAVVRYQIGRDWPRELAMCAPAPGHVGLVLLALPALLILPSGIAELARQVLPSIEYQSELEELLGMWPWWFNIIVVGLAAGLIEEIWCRGFLGRGLLGNYGVAAGVLMTSLLFGLMHLDPPHVVATAAMGLGLHLSYLATRSLYIPILLHVLNNSAAVLQLESERFRSALKRLDGLDQNQLALVYGAAAVLAGVIAWALYRSRARLVVASVEQVTTSVPSWPSLAEPAAASGLIVLRQGPRLWEWGVVLMTVWGFAAIVYFLVLQAG